MADLSQYNFTGYLGGDATVKKTPNNKYVMEMSVAVNTGYGDYKKILWVKVKTWGDRVNNIKDIFKKGSRVAISGEPDIEEWVGKDNENHVTLVVNCMNPIILSSKKSDGAEPAEEPAPETDPDGNPVF